MSTTITLRGLSDLFRDAIRTNSAISTFCTTNYSKSLTLQIGSNPQQPLGNLNAPFCVVSGTGKALGETVQFGWDFDIGFGVDDDDFDDDDISGVKEMHGHYRLEEFGDLVMAAMNGITASYNYQITSQKTSLSTDMFPLLVGVHSLSLTTRNVIGGTIGLT